MHCHWTPRVYQGSYFMGTFIRWNNVRSCLANIHVVGRRTRSGQILRQCCCKADCQTDICSEVHSNHVEVDVSWFKKSTFIYPYWHKISYSGSNIIANVAYDLFTSSSASGSSQYEIMIWLTALGGAGPISSNGSPIATITISGVSWKLYKGMNGSMSK